MTDLHAKDARRYCVHPLCTLFGKSKQAYYKWDEQKQIAQDCAEEAALGFARDLRGIDPRIGVRKIWQAYRKSRLKEKFLGRDCFAQLLSDHHMKLRQKKKRPRTTDSRHDMPVYPNLIWDFIPTAPAQLWVSDITYVKISPAAKEPCWGYLALIMDSYSKEIVGWSLSDTLNVNGAMQALEMALPRLPEQHELIHHSDRGTQYASAAYIKVLMQHGIAISMTERGEPTDNAEAERLNNTLKNELLLGIQLSSLQTARRIIKKKIVFYNHSRPHMSLNMATPQEASRMTGEQKKCWKNFRYEAIHRNRDLPSSGCHMPEHLSVTT